MTETPFLAASKFLARRDRGAVPVPLLPGEAQLDAVVAGLPNGMMGGDLILTNLRLVFAPLDIRDATRMLSWGITFVGGPDTAAKIAGWTADQLSRPRLLGNVVGARAGRNASLRRAPTLIARAADGSEQEFGVLWRRLAMNLGLRNNTERDRFVASINGSPGR